MRNKKNINFDNIQITIQGCNIERVSKVKFLGVWLDEQLNWKSHIAYVSSKVSKVIGILKKVQKCLDKWILRNLYYALVYPYFTYCNITWASNYKSNLDCLVKLQKRVVRIICFENYFAHTEGLFKYVNIMKFEQINKYMTALFVYRALHNMYPKFISDLFLHNSDVHSYNTRQKHNLHFSRFYSNVALFSIRFHGLKIWNGIPHIIRQLIPFHLFKKKLKIHCLDFV